MRIRTALKKTIAILMVAIPVSIMSQRYAIANSWPEVRRGAEESVFFLRTIRAKLDGTNRETYEGTGFLVSKTGYGVTAAHLVPDAEAQGEAKYFASEGRFGGKTYEITVVKRDSELDLAIFQFREGSNWKPLILDDNLNIQRETELYALGFPENSGLASTLGRFTAIGPRGQWQTTLLLNPGYSGGPVLNQNGGVVAVAAGGFDSAQGQTYVIPSGFIKTLLPDSVLARRVIDCKNVAMLEEWWRCKKSVNKE